MALQVKDKIIGVYFGDENDFFCMAERFLNREYSKEIPATRFIESRIGKRDYYSFAEKVKQYVDRYDGAKYMVVDQTNVGEIIAKLFQAPGTNMQRIIMSDKPYREVLENGALLSVPKREIVMTMVALQQGYRLSGGESDTEPSKRLQELREDPVTVVNRLLGKSNDGPSKEDYQLIAVAMTAWYAEYLAGQEPKSE